MSCPGGKYQMKQNTGRIIAVCTSKTKGVRKEVIPQGELKANFGLIGDAHADSTWHRQVSLLAIESINKMRALGLDVNPGDFAENLTTESIDLLSLPIGTMLNVGQDIMLRISQIGKECHTGCAIFQQVGKCVMPKEGVFAEVVEGGIVKAADEIKEVV